MTPNILFVMADDHAANGISSYGSRLMQFAPTRNIDRIGTEGARLDQAYCTNSICTPSRATILTGQYGHLNGVRTLADALDPRRRNVAQLLGAAGYQTAIIGKWHLHAQPSGFDHWEYLAGRGGEQGVYFDAQFETNGVGLVASDGYVTDAITDRTLRWLRGRDKTKPFFLMCHHKAPHDYWQYAPRHEHLLDGITIPEPANLREDKAHRSPASRDFGTTLSPKNSRRSLTQTFTRDDHATGSLDVTGMDVTEQTAAVYQKYLKDYLRCVAGIDESVGAVLDELDGEGILDDTVVMYTSDQGMFLGEHDYQDKRWMFEESLKIPLLVRYPREIAPGSDNRDITTNLDFAPTFLDYAGAAVPDDMQGRSMRANLAGRTPADWPRSMYYRYWMHMAHHDVPGHYGIRTRRHKLVFYYGLKLDASYDEYEQRTNPGFDHPATPAGWELYDLESDPEENDNLYQDPAQQGLIAELKDELIGLKRLYRDTDDNYPDLLERLDAS